MKSVSATRDDLDGTGWEVPPVPASSAAPTPREVLTARAARGWYVGASISLIWLFIVATEAVAAADTAVSSAVVIALLVCFAASFLIAVPFAVISLIAIVFLPNKPLTTMTTVERLQASEADLATVSVPEAMETLTATGSVRTVRTGTRDDG